MVLLERIKAGMYSLRTWLIGVWFLLFLLYGMLGWAGDIVGVRLEGGDISQAKIIWNELPKGTDEGIAKVLEFYSALAVGKNDWWANLSPRVSEDNIVGDGLKASLLGYKLVEIDLHLKRDVQQLLAKVDYLDFASDEYDDLQSWVRFWIVPKRVDVRIGENFIVVDNICFDVKFQSSNLSLKEFVDKNILPELRKRVNDKNNYAELFRICRYAILSWWCRKHFLGIGNNYAPDHLWSKRKLLDKFLNLFSSWENSEWISGGVYLFGDNGTPPLKISRVNELSPLDIRKQTKFFDYLSAGVFKLAISDKDNAIANDNLELLLLDSVTKSVEKRTANLYFNFTQNEFEGLKRLLKPSGFSDKILTAIVDVFTKVASENGWHDVAIYKMPAYGHDIFGTVLVTSDKRLIICLSDDVFEEDGSLSSFGAYVLIHEILHAVFRGGYAVEYVSDTDKDKLRIVRRGYQNRFLVDDVLLEVNCVSFPPRIRNRILFPYKNNSYKVVSKLKVQEKFIGTFFQMFIAKYGAELDWKQTNWYVRVYRAKQLYRLEKMSEKLTKLNLILAKLDCPVRRRIFILSIVYSYSVLRDKIDWFSDYIVKLYKALFPEGYTFPKRSLAKQGFWKFVSEGMLRNINRFYNDDGAVLEFLSTIRAVFEQDSSQIEDLELYKFIADYLIVTPPLAKLWVKMYKPKRNFKIKHELNKFFDWYRYTLADGMITENSESIAKINLMDRMEVIIDGKIGDLPLLKESLLLTKSQVKKEIAPLLEVNNSLVSSIFSWIDSSLPELKVYFIPFILKNRFVFIKDDVLIVPISFFSKKDNSFNFMGKIALFHGVLEILLKKGMPFQINTAKLSKQERMLYEYAKKAGIKEKALFYDTVLLDGHRWTEFIGMMQVATGRFKHAVFWPLGRNKLKRIKEELIKQGHEGLALDLIDSAINKGITPPKFKKCRLEAWKILKEIISGESWLEELFGDEKWFKEYKSELLNVYYASYNLPTFIKNNKLLGMFLSLADLIKWHNLAIDKQLDLYEKKKLNGIISLALKLSRYPLRISWELFFNMHYRFCSHKDSIEEVGKGGILLLN